MDIQQKPLPGLKGTPYFQLRSVEVPPVPHWLATCPLRSLACSKIVGISFMVGRLCCRYEFCSCTKATWSFLWNLSFDRTCVRHSHLKSHLEWNNVDIWYFVWRKQFWKIMTVCFIQVICIIESVGRLRSFPQTHCVTFLLI